MNKSVNDLDPKLKEAYDRIMGTNFTPAKPASTPKQPEQNTPLMQTEPVIQKTPVQPPPQANNMPSPQFSQAPEPPISVFTQNGPVKSPIKKNINLTPVMLGLGGVVFFVAYIFIWLKVFGLL